MLYVDFILKDRYPHSAVITMIITKMSGSCLFLVESFAEMDTQLRAELGLGFGKFD